MSFEITTDRLILKVLDSAYAPMVLLFYENNRTLFEAFEPTRPQNFYTLDFQTAFMDYEYRDTIKGKTLRYYIFPKNDPDTLIGSVNFSNIVHGPFSHTSIGYKLDSSYHGFGYATEACRAAVEIIFSTYKIHRIEARIAPENIPSIKLIERLGFLCEGMEYKSIEVNGTFRDHCRYSLLAH